MEKETFNIPNISCGHCVMAVKNELNELAGIVNVEGDPQTKNVTVKYDEPANSDSIKAKLQEINYPVQ